ncbi:MAG TPA: hypothetical protein VFW77_04690, partial [Candidatus Saccharimonadales bacterium]|nr:hypothetical protein [Candidatus Saccharimonadales bacterium]
GTHPLSSADFPGKLNFFVNGKQVASYTVSSSPSTKSYKYRVAVSGSKEVRAQVIDSVLYDSSDSRTVSFSGAENNSSISHLSAANHANNTTITWKGGAAPFTVTDDSTGSVSCSSSGCSVPKSQAPPGSTITVTDKNGKSKSTVVSGGP